MKRLESNQISELRKTMPVLDSQELLSFIGGDGKKYYFNESGQIDTNLTTDFKDSGTFDIIVVNGQEFKLKGCVSQDNQGRVSFEGSQALYEFMVQNTSAEWGYGYNFPSLTNYSPMDSGWEDEYDFEDGLITTSGEPSRLIPEGCRWIQYDSFAHSHDTKLSEYDITEEQLKEINGLPSEADIKNLDNTNKKRNEKGFLNQEGVIYDEKSGTWNSFNSNSYTQEDYIRDHKIKKKKN